MNFLIELFLKGILTIFSLYIPNGIVGKKSLMYEIKLPKWFEYIIIGTPFDAPMNVAMVPLLIDAQTRLILTVIYVYIFDNNFCFSIGANIANFMFLFEMVIVVVYMIKYGLRVQTNPYYFDKKIKTKQPLT